MAQPVAVFNHFDLKPYNTFGINAFAGQAAFITSVAELDYLRSLGKLSEQCLVIGGGSNLLFQGNYDGLVLINRLMGLTILNETEQDVTVKWAAGEIWHQAVMTAIGMGWGGIENMALIPGCIGAAPMQNIGAYGVELKDVFKSVEVYELATGRVYDLNHDECQFGYRESVFKHELKGKVMILSVTLKLTKAPYHQLKLGYGAIKDVLTERNITSPRIKDVAEAVISIRQSKLPDPAVLGNAGSFFKNPELDIADFDRLKTAHPEVPSYPAPAGKIKVPAGWLIEQAGLKGYNAGNCGVHKAQALVLVNYGQATGAEIIKLAHLVMDTVYQKYGVRLSPEVNWVP